MHYIGNRRLEAIGIEYRFPTDNNSFPWLDEVVNVQAMGNFERRVREYQQSGSLEDDFWISDFTILIAYSASSKQRVREF